MAGNKVAQPNIALHNPKPLAVFANTKSNQNKLTNVPETIPAIAPLAVIPFQYNAPKNTGKNAAAQISKNRLVPIGGTPINLLNMPKGCAFCPRCDEAMKICLNEKPEEIWVGEDHLAACWMNIKRMVEEEGKSNE